MTYWKKLGKKLLFPPLWVQILLTVICTAGLVVIFVKGLDSHPIAYAVYVASFYTLSVVGIFCGMVLPSRYKAIKQRLYANKLMNRYMTDPVFKNNISLYLSLGVNLMYITVNLFSGFWYRTRWFYILAGYYGILAAMRFLLVRYINKNTVGSNIIAEWKRSRICAAILTLVNISLSGAVLMMMYQNRGFKYHGILIYIMAMYTFYITVTAIVDIVKYRKYNSPVMMTAKSINLAAALVSMLSLETAMLTAFGTDTSITAKRVLIASTGAGICAVVIAMSSYMIIRSTKEIKKEELKTE